MADGWLRRMALLSFVFSLALPCAANLAPADEIDDAVGLAPGDALERLETLLQVARTEHAAAQEAGAEDRVQAVARRLVRIREGLVGVLLARNEHYAALTPLEALVRTRGSVADRIGYAAALVSVARANLGAGRSTAAGIVPYLDDALETLNTLPLEPPADEALPNSLAVRDPALRAQLVALVMEAHFLQRKYEQALSALERGTIGSLPKESVPALFDMQARCHYALEQWPAAAAAFQRCGNPLGAAAAWDAARRPENSIPLYAAAIRGTPADAGLLQRALAGARFTKAEGALLEALEAIPVPQGQSGAALLEARARLLESVGRASEALERLREVAERDPRNADALVDVGRLLIVTGDRAGEDVWDAAAAAYGEALRRDPAHAGAVAGLGFIAGRDFNRLWSHWRNEQVVGRCLQVQRAMVAAAPDDALALSNLGNTLRVLGRARESLAAYARAREANPFDPSVESDLGLALSGAGRAEEALTAYLRSVELDPGHLAGRQNAARSLWLTGKDTEAAAQLGAAARTARAVGRGPGTYRFLMERIWRTQHRPDLR